MDHDMIAMMYNEGYEPLIIKNVPIKDLNNLVQKCFVNYNCIDDFFYDALYGMPMSSKKHLGTISEDEITCFNSICKANNIVATSVYVRFSEEQCLFVSSIAWIEVCKNFDCYYWGAAQDTLLLADDFSWVIVITHEGDFFCMKSPQVEFNNGEHVNKN